MLKHPQSWEVLIWMDNCKTMPRLCPTGNYLAVSSQYGNKSSVTGKVVMVTAWWLESWFPCQHQSLQPWVSSVSRQPSTITFKHGDCVKVWSTVILFLEYIKDKIWLNIFSLLKSTLLNPILILIGNTNYSNQWWFLV